MAAPLFSLSAMITTIIVFALVVLALRPTEAQRRGVGACPPHWTPQGDQGNGCPLVCINEVTGEKLHLLVRYSLKGVVLKDCQQCEVRWIEGTDCVLVVCPEENRPCPPEQSQSPEVTPPSSGQEQTRSVSSKPFSLLRKAFSNATVIRTGGNRRQPPAQTFPLRQTTNVPQATSTEKEYTTVAAGYEGPLKSALPETNSTIKNKVPLPTTATTKGSHHTSRKDLATPTPSFVAATTSPRDDVHKKQMQVDGVPLATSTPTFSDTSSPATTSPLPLNTPAGPAQPPKIKPEYKAGTRFQSK